MGKVIRFNNPISPLNFRDLYKYHLKYNKYLYKIRKLEGNEDKRICGIYLLIEKSNIVYVGQSVDIHRRIDEHRINKSFNNVYYFELKKCFKYALDYWELKFVLHLRPIYNRTFSHHHILNYIRMTYIFDEIEKQMVLRLTVSEMLNYLERDGIKWRSWGII